MTYRNHLLKAYRIHPPVQRQRGDQVLKEIPTLVLLTFAAIELYMAWDQIMNLEAFTVPHLHAVQ